MIDDLVKTRSRFGIALAVLLFAGIASAADQPQWGEWQTRNMVSAEKGLPDRFDPATGGNIKWSVPLGTQTNSSPVIAGGKVLIGTNNGEPRDPRHEGDRGVLMCLDEKDGHLHWQLVVPKLERRLSDWPRTGICSPATVEGERVYLVSNRGEVMCLDLNGQANGNDGPFRDEGRHMAPPSAAPLKVTKTDADIIWLFDIRKELGVHQHDAAHCSVLVDDDILYVCTSNGVSDDHHSLVAVEAPSLIALDKRTGRLVARDNERMAPRTIHCTWSSPSLGRIADKELVFFGGGDAVCYAFEALQGASPEGKVTNLKRAWRFNCDTESPKGDIMKFQDNRRVGPSTITGMPVFAGGRIYLTAGGDFWHGKPECWLKCLDASGTGDITRTGEKWSYPLVRHCMSTPAIANGLVFIGDCGRTLHCVDAKTGKACWTHKVRGEIWASTLVADGKVYVGTRSGQFLVLAAAREKKVLSEVQLEPVNSTPTAANGVLYVATAERLYAIAQGHR